MTATLLAPGKYKHKFTTSHRKEKRGFTEELAVIIHDPRPWHERESRAPVVARIYWAGQTCYACLWADIRAVDSPGYSSDTRNGSGFASGGGYHKASAALQEAIQNAGFVLSEAIDGRGNGMMEDALLAVADACGYPEGRLHRAHA